jgi:hypothetical protein
MIYTLNGSFLSICGSTISRTLPMTFSSEQPPADEMK